MMDKPWMDRMPTKTTAERVADAFNDVRLLRARADDYESQAHALRDEADTLERWAVATRKTINGETAQ